MYNAINKTVIAACALLLAAACADKEKEAAADLCRQTQQAIENRDYSRALTLLDTIDIRYRAQTDIRRQGIRLRAQAMEGIAMDSISSQDRALAQATIDAQAMAAKFKHIEDKVGLEAYYIPLDASDKVMTTTGVQPRISDQGFFYAVANVQGRAIGLNGFEITDGAEAFTSRKLSPSRIVSVEGSESASFSPEDIRGLGEWLIEHPKASGLIITGSKSNVKLKLDPKLRSQFIECYTYAKALNAKHLATVRREKYERMLATARDQLANAPAEQ